MQRVQAVQGKLQLLAADRTVLQLLEDHQPLFERVDLLDEVGA